MPKIKSAKFSGMKRKARHKVKSSGVKKRRMPKKLTEKTRIIKQKINKITDYKSSASDRLNAGIFLIKTLGNIQAIPHIKKMMLNDPKKGIRINASDFFFQLATMKKTKKQTVNQIIKILSEAYNKEKDNITRLYIKSHIKIIEDFQKRRG